jgi:flagellar biosynthetic protein FlhB
VAEEDNSQKTEEPTQRRLDKAFEEGSVSKSTEVSSWFLLAAAALIVAWAAPEAARAMRNGLIAFIERPETIDLSGRGAEAMASALGLMLLKALGLPALLLMVAAVAGHLIQSRPTWSATPLEPKLDKLSPIKGFSRVFGAQGWVNLLKAIFKFAVIGTVSFLVLWPQRAKFAAFLGADPAAILPGTRVLVLKVLIAVLVALAAIAIADLFYQRLSHRQKLRMTKQEVKDEHKETEGDPQIKARIRQLRQERSRRRMMAAVPTATVVVTNPTHYSIALRYDELKAPAPVVVAKGMDELALRIRFAAKEHDIPIVENPPLARALHATVDVDEMIPEEHYRAVAEVISYVYKLKNRGRKPSRGPNRAASRLTRHSNRLT